MHRAEELFGSLPPLGLADAAQAQRQLDVSLHGEPREEGRFLEHQGDPAPGVDSPGGGLVEAGDEVEERALAAARRADEADELAGADLEGHAVEGVDGGLAVTEDLGGAFDADRVAAVAAAPTA